MSYSLLNHPKICRNQLHTVTMKSPTILSPSIPPTDNFPLYSRTNGQLPLQQPVSSASRMPNSPSHGSFSSHIASFKYVEQHRLFLEHQRQLHNEERELWHQERQELHAKISELETTVRQLQHRSNSDIISPTGVSGFALAPFGSFSSNRGSRTTSGSTGDEFWRGAGGKSDAVPTRTFSESSEYSTARSDDRWMPSIAEDNNSGQAVVSRQTSHESPESHHKPSIDGAEIDKNLDGISFKPSAVAPSFVKSIITPQSPSPLQSSPFSNPPEQSASEVLAVVDPYIQDAGHTPLARGLSPHVFSDNASELATPTMSEQGSQVREPRPSIAISRQPNERSNSYFPPPPETIEEDPELAAPLGLQNQDSEDTNFLNELDSKLLQAAKSAVFSPAETEQSSEPKKENNAEMDGKNFEQSENEPKLRIKRSMNFGSVFGAKKCGKGI